MRTLHRTLFGLLLIAGFSACQDDVRPCDFVREGSFVVRGSEGPYFVERYGNVQTEGIKDEYSVEFEVEWTGPCTYLLLNRTETIGDSGLPEDMKADTTFVEIKTVDEVKGTLKIHVHDTTGYPDVDVELKKLVLD